MERCPRSGWNGCPRSVEYAAEALAAIEHAQATPVQGELALTQEHPLIRCADDYAELFAQGAAQLSEPGCAGAPPTATTTSATATALEPKA